MMTSRRILLLGSCALPLVLFACGGKVFLDSDADTSSGGTSHDAGADTVSPGTPGVPFAACGSTPQMIAQSVEPAVSIVVGDAYAAFSTTLGDNSGAVGTVAVRLSDGAVRAVREASRPTIQRDGALLALTGTSLVFSVATRSPIGDTNSIDLVDDWDNPIAGRGSFSSNSALIQFSSASDGTIFGISRNRDPGLTKGEAWEFTLTPKTVSPLPKYYTHDGGILSDVSAFVGGFAAVTADAKEVYAGIRSKRQTVLFRTMDSCWAGRRVRTSQTSPSSAASVYLLRNSTCSDVAVDQIVLDQCSIDAAGVQTCAFGPPPPLLEETNNRHIHTFDVLADGSVVAAVLDSSGLRPIAQLVRVHDGTKDVIGGEGVTGTVDNITAVTTHGNCVYWAEKSSAGNRIMRVAR